MGTSVKLPLIVQSLVQVFYSLYSLFIFLFGEQTKLWYKFCNPMTKVLSLAFRYGFRIPSFYNKYRMLKQVTSNIAEATAPIRAAEPSSTSAFKRYFSISILNSVWCFSRLHQAETQKWSLCHVKLLLTAKCHPKYSVLPVWVTYFCYAFCFEKYTLEIFKCAK